MYEDPLPYWCENCLHDKAAFSRAYNNITPGNRALLKKNIAELSKWYNIDNYPKKREIKTLNWTQGWKTMISKKPVDCAMVGIPEDFSSPAVLLSVLMPLKIAGVDKVLVFRCCRDSITWPDSLLLALELAGVEDVYDFSLEQVENLLQETRNRGQSATWVFVNYVDNFPFFSLAYKHAARYDILSLFAPQSCGIWLDNNIFPDLEALEFANPDLELHFWSPDSEMLSCIPGQYHRQSGEWTDFCNSDFDLVFAPVDLHAQLLGKFPVVLGKGEECSWIWPDLSLERFERHGLALSNSS